MTAASPSDSPAAPAASIEHVVHVVGDEVADRFAPMLIQVFQGLMAGGVRVSVVTDDPDLVTRPDGAGIEFHLLHRVSGWRAWGLDRYLAARFTPPPQVLHLWGSGGLFWVRRWSRQVSTPVLIHALGRSQVERLTHGGLHANEHVLAAAGHLADELESRLRRPEGRCHRVLPAIAPPIVPSAAPEAERTLSVLCASRFSELAGLNVLVDSIAQLRRSGTDVQVALVGGGPGIEGVWRRMRAEGVRESISLIDDPRLWERALPDVEVCVVPACQRELSIVPLLAMSLGKIVIASRDQLAEWFVEDETCWQFTAGSAVELAYLLARAIEQPKHARELCAAAREYVRAHHAVRDLTAKLEALYAQAVATRPPPSPGVGRLPRAGLAWLTGRAPGSQSPSRGV